MGKMYVVSTHENSINYKSTFEAREPLSAVRKAREAAAMECVKNDEMARSQQQLKQKKASDQASMHILKKTMVEILKSAEETRDKFGEEDRKSVV